MDGTIIKAHEHATGAEKNKVTENSEGLGRGRGGLSSEIHCVANGLSNPIDFMLARGKVHDSQCAEKLL